MKPIIKVIFKVIRFTIFVVIGVILGSILGSILNIESRLIVKEIARTSDQVSKDKLKNSWINRWKTEDADFAERTFNFYWALLNQYPEDYTDYIPIEYKDNEIVIKYYEEYIKNREIALDDLDIGHTFRIQITINNKQYEGLTLNVIARYYSRIWGSRPSKSCLDVWYKDENGKYLTIPLSILRLNGQIH